MKNIQNALLLKNLTILKHLGYKYTDEDLATRDSYWLDLPDNIDEIGNIASNCHLCKLSKNRTSALLGQGNGSAKLMLVGFSPNDEESMGNNIYSSKRGEMLTKMIENVIGAKTKDIYFTNVLKCPTRESTDDLSMELDKCRPYIEKEIELVSPKLVVALGERAYRSLVDNGTTFENARGEIFRTKKYHLIAINDPDFLEKNPSAKKDTMLNLQKIKNFL